MRYNFSARLLKIIQEILSIKIKDRNFFCYTLLLIYTILLYKFNRCNGSRDFPCLLLGIVFVSVSKISNLFPEYLCTSKRYDICNIWEFLWTMYQIYPQYLSLSYIYNICKRLIYIEYISGSLSLHTAFLSLISCSIY